MQTNMHMCIIDACAFMGACVWVRVCVCMCVCVLYVYVHTHIYTLTYAPTVTHVHFKTSATQACSRRVAAFSRRATRVLHAC